MVAQEPRVGHIFGALPRPQPRRRARQAYPPKTSDDNQKVQEPSPTSHPVEHFNQHPTNPKHYHGDVTTALGTTSVPQHASHGNGGEPIDRSEEHEDNYVIQEVQQGENGIGTTTASTSARNTDPIGCNLPDTHMGPSRPKTLASVDASELAASALGSTDCGHDSVSGRCEICSGGCEVRSHTSLRTITKRLFRIS